MASVKKVESDGWIKSIREASADRESTDRFTGTGGHQGLTKLPFSQQAFKKVAEKFLIHRSIIRVIRRADVPEFSATKLKMGDLNGWAPPAYVYDARTSNAWHGDLALSATYFPHSKLTFAVLFGCSLSIEAEILTRLGKTAHEIGHPLIMPGIVFELELSRHQSVVEEELKEVEARALGVSDFMIMLRDGTLRTQEVKKKTKRDKFLDLKYLTGQLNDWKNALRAMHDHADTITPSDTHWDASKQEMKHTGTKIQGRLQEVMSDYEIMMRACAAATEGMNIPIPLID
ncbi:kinase [Fusarium beomiforme]|uniref:Kinase n=1 Tax=Fusarium beomiforme TaxID=44412 RepID=A0A9P5ATR5_9HYPO|nr:kinase [Fusarium beomiforme]